MFDLRRRELSGSRLAIAFDKVRIYCSFISSIRTNTNEDNVIGTKNLFLENAEN